jgi:GTP:adenosylcobinamide-phosphate guanylyltransferase
MTQQANFVQEGVDRLREAVSAIETDIERMQNRVQKEFKARRKDIEKRTQKQVKRLRTELRKNAYVKRAQGVVDDATKQFEQGVDSVLEVLNVASKRDLTRIERKLNQINRKLRDLEKAKQGNVEASIV